MKVTVLGCGGSKGIPVVARGWGKCDPKNPKNRRMRSSLLIETCGKTILVDAAPESRQQLLDAGISHIDAVFLTHIHSDHILGLDDLRPLAFVAKKDIPVFGSAETLSYVRKSFSWLFEEGDPNYPPCMTTCVLEEGECDIAGVPAIVFPQAHGIVTTLGLRMGTFAYSPDCSIIPETSLARLGGLDTWIIAATLKHAGASRVHAPLSLVLEWARRLAPKRAFLTHMGHEMDYDTLCAELPPGILPAHDGLVVEVA